MIRSLNTAERAMQMEQVKIEALANNLANVTTTGFRQILTRVAETGQGNQTGKVTADPQAGATGDTGQLALERPTASWKPTEMYHAMDPRSGPVQATGRDTDLAIMGRGFFTVQTEAGERYTRGGSFVLDAQKRLTTPQGEVVVGDGGPITIAGQSFGIASDGTVTVDGQVTGKVKLVDFEDSTRLTHEGGSLLKAPEDMPAQDVPAAEVVLAQGHLEGSNVNPIDTLVAMIAAQRAFEVQAKVLSTEDELLQKSVNNLPRISG